MGRCGQKEAHDVKKCDSSAETKTDYFFAFARTERMKRPLIDVQLLF